MADPNLFGVKVWENILQCWNSILPLGAPMVSVGNLVRFFFLICPYKV